MATITNITTGEQSVAATGAITGTLDVSGYTSGANVTVKGRARGSSSSKSFNIVLEGSVNGTFSDAEQLASMQITGGVPTDGETMSLSSSQNPALQKYIGAASNKLRFNCLSLTSGGTLTFYGWAEA